MKIKFSGLGVVDGRGKINGTVASKNRSGAYARVKVSGVNPQTSYQLNVRARLTSFSQLWRTLGAAIIDQWNSVANQFARTNVFGDGVSPTGKNLYTRLNANLGSVGVAAISSPPLPEGAEQPIAGTFIATAGGVKSIAHSGTTAASKIQIWATAGQSAGVRFLKNKYRLVTTVNGGGASPQVFTTAYDAKFGDVVAGQYLGCKLVAINATTGENSLPSESTTIAV